MEGLQQVARLHVLPRESLAPLLYLVARAAEIQRSERLLVVRVEDAHQLRRQVVHESQQEEGVDLPLLRELSAPHAHHPRGDPVDLWVGFIPPQWRPVPLVVARASSAVVRAPPAARGVVIGASALWIEQRVDGGYVRRSSCGRGRDDLQVREAHVQRCARAVLHLQRKGLHQRLAQPRPHQRFKLWRLRVAAPHRRARHEGGVHASHRAHAPVAKLGEALA
eukprot:CAMPEP_0195597948 /NCGR_PEP_ID=MMETSP0815-20121206/3257_1 /TAXON_ID=97485 /ORGANISM="Prymnesium parvum, Strain Texoma1" /LENGTH=221 /DNA_ID=CAMNT_0040737323 /DNA_START=392 /DNA_END=1054 /DNA_ORIENTATION=-